MSYAISAKVKGTRYKATLTLKKKKPSPKLVLRYAKKS